MMKKGLFTAALILLTTSPAPAAPIGVVGFDSLTHLLYQARMDSLTTQILPGGFARQYTLQESAHPLAGRTDSAGNLAIPVTAGTNSRVEVLSPNGALLYSVPMANMPDLHFDDQDNLITVEQNSLLQNVFRRYDHAGVLTDSCTAALPYGAIGLAHRTEFYAGGIYFVATEPNTTQTIYRLDFASCQTQALMTNLPSFLDLRLHFVKISGVLVAVADWYNPGYGWWTAATANSMIMIIEFLPNPRLIKIESAQVLARSNMVFTASGELVLRQINTQGTRLLRTHNLVTGTTGPQVTDWLPAGTAITN